MIRLISIRPEENRFRFYVLDCECTLFGYWVTLRFGRIAKRGRTETHHFETKGEAETWLRAKLLRRKRHGYRIEAMNPQWNHITRDIGFVSLPLSEKDFFAHQTPTY